MRPGYDPVNLPNLTLRVATRWLQASYFEPGQVVLYGKYKNHRGKVIGFGADHWGNPTIEIEPIPKGRKQNKIFGLFKIWRADVKENALKEQAEAAKALTVEARVAARFTADLSPPLGKPGGPCQVVQRIDKTVKNPAEKQNLIEDIESGESLSNPDAAKVYRIETEAGSGIIGKILITSHAQYRMDLRSITVEDVKKSLAGFGTQLASWQQQGSKAFTHFAGMLERGEKVEWVDPRSKLDVVFQLVSGDTVRLITTYWKGVKDPAPSGDCRL